MNRYLVSGYIERDVCSGTIDQKLDLGTLGPFHHPDHGILWSLGTCNDPLTNLDDTVPLKETGLLRWSSRHNIDDNSCVIGHIEDYSYSLEITGKFTL